MFMTRNLIVYALLLILNSTISVSKAIQAENIKSYHFIYLDISLSTDRKNLTDKLLELLDNISKRNDDYLLYLSNGYKPEILSSGNSQKRQIDKIVSLLQTLNSSPPILMFDKDSILNIWDKNDIVNYSKDGEVKLNYKNLYFHYFVSSELFKLDEDELIDRFLLVKDLTKKHIDTKKIIIEILYSKVGSGLFVDRETQLKNSNNTGYKYLFTSY
jgi:hypothetical protein